MDHLLLTSLDRIVIGGRVLRAWSTFTHDTVCTIDLWHLGWNHLGSHLDDHINLFWAAVACFRLFQWGKVSFRQYLVGRTGFGWFWVVSGGFGWFRVIPFLVITLNFHKITSGLGGLSMPCMNLSFWASWELHRYRKNLQKLKFSKTSI